MDELVYVILPRELTVVGVRCGVRGATSLATKVVLLPPLPHLASPSLQCACSVAHCDDDLPSRMPGLEIRKRFLRLRELVCTVNDSVDLAVRHQA